MLKLITIYIRTSLGSTASYFRFDVCEVTSVATWQITIILKNRAKYRSILSTRRGKSEVQMQDDILHLN